MHTRTGTVRLRTGVLAAFLAAAVLPLAARATTFLRLYRDESKIIRVDGLKRVSVTNPQVATPVIISPAEIMLNGLQVGRTSLYIWDQNGRTEIQVVVRPFTDELQKKLEEDIDDPDVKIQVIAEGESERVFLRGVLASQAAYRNAIAVAGAYIGAGNVVDLLEVRGVSEDPLSQLKRLIDNPEIDIQIVTEPQATGQQGNAPTIASIIMEGYVDDQRDMDRALAIARSFVGGDLNRITNLMEVVNPLQVLVEGHLIEMSRQENSQIGVTWGTVQTAVSNGVATLTNFAPDTMVFLENFLYNVPRGALGSIGGPNPEGVEDLKRINPIFSSLQMQLSSGQAKVIHNPKVVTRSGLQARIFVGGESGAIVSGQFGAQQAEFREFGLNMQVTPTVDHKGNINTQVQIELSNPDAGLGATLAGSTVPGFRRRSTENNVTVKDGEHIIISGLINKEEQKLVSKVPLLWKIPVLGRLFQNKRFQNSETELVIIITPHLLASKRLRERFYNDNGSEVGQTVEAGLANDQSAGQIEQALRSDEQNQKMVREMFASLQGGGADQGQVLTNGITVRDSKTVLAARAAEAAPATGGTVDPMTGMARQGGAAVDSSDRIRRMLEARRRTGRGSATREALVRLQPGLPPLPGASEVEPVGGGTRSGLELAERGPLPQDLSPPELPSLVPVSGSISTRIHGIFDEVETDPAFRRLPEAPASTGRSTGDAALDARVDQLFDQIKSKLDGGAF